MNITHDDIVKVICGGDPAGKFHPDVIVYSDMAVRVMIYNALCHFKERYLTSKSSRPDNACPNYHARLVKQGWWICPDCHKKITGG